MQSTRSRRFEGKSLIITGAAQAVGKQVVLDAAEEGARFLVADRSPIVEEVAAAVEAAHGPDRAIVMVEDTRPMLETSGSCSGLKTLSVRSMSL
ncbi:hypothetical protein ACO2RV_22225 [Ancylobacter sp. VNQ12]|uniref:hypothetical protein n=1 Tax=Ancylobacter sp. VNQ12 TaxID=3400920 RepID=UPI003C091E6A